MKLGILKKGDSIMLAVWVRIPSIPRFAMIGLGLRPGDVTLGMLVEVK